MEILVASIVDRKINKGGINMKGVYILIKDKDGEVLRGATISISDIQMEVMDALSEGNYVQIRNI